MKRVEGLKWLGLLMQVVFSLFCLYWISMQTHAAAAQVVQRLWGTALLPLMLGVLCFPAAIGLVALRYSLFLPTRISFTYMVGIALFHNALLTFIPWRLGEMGYPLFLRRDCNIQVMKSTAAILAVRLVDLTVILSVVLVGNGRLNLGRSETGILLGATVLLAILAGFLLRMWRSEPPGWLKTFILTLEPLRKPRRLMILLLLSVGVFALTTLQSKCILQAVALTLTVPSVALLNAATLLAAVLPIHSPGGWGTMDSIQILLLERLGYSPKASTSSILAAHALYMVITLAGGAIGWLLRAKSCFSLNTGTRS